MKLHLRLRDQARTLRQLFEKAGWRVDSADDDRLCVSHASIASEAEARERLDAMGLLTSSRVQIEFWPSALSTPEAEGGSVLGVKVSLDRSTYRHGVAHPK